MGHRVEPVAAPNVLTTISLLPVTGGGYGSLLFRGSHSLPALSIRSSQSKDVIAVSPLASLLSAGLTPHPLLLAAAVAVHAPVYLAVAPVLVVRRDESARTHTS